MASKLAPSLRALMGHRGAPAGAPSAAALSQLYDKLRVESQQQSIGEPAWMTLAARQLYAAPSDTAQSASLVTLNSPKALEHLANYANSFGGPSKAEQVSRAELLREVGLKCISFIGIAKVINQLGALANATDPAVRDAMPAQQSRMPTPDNVQSTYERGMALWKAR